jgi:hypothetical protein
VDHQHLKILQVASQTTQSFRVDASTANWAIYKELWQAGCFEGVDHRDHQNQLDLLEIDGLSARGRETRDELYGTWTSLGLWKKSRCRVYAWFLESSRWSSRELSCIC